jgi:hypothetical protein
VIDQVRDQVRAQVIDQVRAQVSDQVGAQVIDQVRDQVSDQVRDQVIDQVIDQVRDQVRAQVRAQVRDLAWWGFRGWTPGQFEAFWLSYLETFRDYCDFDRLHGLVEVAESCAWAWTFPDLVVFCQPPVVINRDERGRLHCEDGAAVLFADGWGLWAWHGVRVPQRVIESRNGLTVEEALSEQNAEIRRVMLLRIGPQRIEHEGALKVLDDVEDDQVEIGTGRDGLPVPVGLRGARLYELPSRDGTPAMRWVALVNSTPESDGGVKRYFLRVPPTSRTVREAVAWTFDVPTEEYEPVAET